MKAESSNEVSLVNMLFYAAQLTVRGTDKSSQKKSHLGKSQETTSGILLHPLAPLNRKLLRTLPFQLSDSVNKTLEMRPEEIMIHHLISDNYHMLANITVDA